MPQRLAAEGNDSQLIQNAPSSRGTLTMSLLKVNWTRKAMCIFCTFLFRTSQSKYTA